MESTSASVILDKRLGMFKTYLDRTNMEHKEYQYEGVKWCLINELRSDPPFKIRGGFIADEMGLGKTIMMIGLMYSNFVSRTLIIVPPVLIDQWFLQIYRTTGHKALVYHGSAKKKITGEMVLNAKIVIATYNAITPSKKQFADKELLLLHKVKWQRVIFDEAHHLRNCNTRQYFGSRLLSANIRWLVSGTPIQNRKQDFYSLCGLLGLPSSFYTENKNLRSLAKSFILKRTKKQVGIHIADISQVKDVVDWKSVKERELAEELHSALSFSRVKVNHESGSGSSGSGSKRIIMAAFRELGVLSLMLRAKQSCIYPKLMTKKLDKMVSLGLMGDYSSYREAFDYSSKLSAATDCILERKGNGCGKLVFCHFREEIDEIAKRLRDGGIAKVATFDGRTSNAKRRQILSEENEVLILQIQTGCEGLNLQEKYSEIYFISPHWNPAIEDQAIARCHRIGQTRPVYVKRFEMRPFDSQEVDIDTLNIDKYVGLVQGVKRSIANEIIA